MERGGFARVYVMRVNTANRSSATFGRRAVDLVSICGPSLTIFLLLVELSDLEAWADRYAHWLCGGPKPTRTQEEVDAALEIEEIEPWGPGGIP